MASITIKDKAAAYSVNHGYSLRVSATPSSVVVHSTNNANPTPFASEVKFLFESPLVSAHYLIGKAAAEGVVRFLDPARYSAWHAGKALPGFENEESIGVELHVSVGEAPTRYQIDTLTDLVLMLRSQFGIALEKIETHRAIAVPQGRKTDPEGWGDVAFYSWRAGLIPRPTPPAPSTDPLRAKQIQGIDRVYYCGEGFFTYYHTYGGVRSLGYPLGDEFKTVDTAGEACTFMSFERGALKYKASGKPWQIQPALLSELSKMGLV